MEAFFPVPVKMCSSPSRSIVSLLLAATLFGGCADPYKGTIGAGHDRVFLQYWPPPQGDKKLRLAVKDLIDMKGVVTTAGSEYFLKANRPAKEDAACLTIARERGVNIVGKTNMSEFAISPSGVNDYFGTPRSPLSPKLKLVPGGSSCGSAVAVATGLADVAFGTDTTGSIRLPAACCGIVGLKTTLGLVPLKGTFPIDPIHLDTIGPLGADVAHTVLGMGLLERGFEGKYQAARAAHPTARGLKVGRLYLDGTNPKIDRAIDAALAAKHFEVVPLDAAFKEKWGKAKFYAGAMGAAGAWVNDRKFTSEKGISKRTKAVVALGQVAFTTGYKELLARRLEWQAAVRDVLRKVDFIAVPTAQDVPPKFEPFVSSVLFETKILALQNTAPANLSGNPALALPVPLDDKYVPLTSLQLIGRPRAEAELLNAGRIIEAKE